MMDLKTAISILGIVVGLCIILSIGGLLSNKNIQPGKIYRTMIILACIGVVVYLIYSAWYLLSGQTA